MQAPRGSKARKGATAMEVAQRALSLARRNAADPERKVFQKSTQTTNFLAGTVVALGDVSQGVTSASRTGEAIRARNLKMRMKCYALTPSDTTFRFVLVRSTLVAPTISGGAAPVFLTDDTMAQRDVRFEASHHIIKDEVVTLNASFLNGDVAANIEWDLNLGDLPITYQGASTNYERNGLWLLIMNDVADAASAVTKPAIGDTGVLYRTDLTFVDP